MDKKEFMDFLDFPSEWLEFDLYSDELFEIQMEHFLKDDDLSEDERERKLFLKKYGWGSEHYRYGAFWWVVKVMGYSVLDKLMLVMEKDPDEPMRWAVTKDLVKLKNYETCNGLSFNPETT